MTLVPDHRAADLKAQKIKEREAALCEQAVIEEDVKKFLESELEKQVQRRRDKKALQEELDRGLADREALDHCKRKQEEAEEAQRKIFEAAKKVYREGLVDCQQTGECLG